MCPDPPADLSSAYPHLAFTRKTTNLPLCGRTHHLPYGSVGKGLNTRKVPTRKKDIENSPFSLPPRADLDSWRCDYNNLKCDQPSADLADRISRRVSRERAGSRRGREYTVSDLSVPRLALSRALLARVCTSRIRAQQVSPYRIAYDYHVRDGAHTWLAAGRRSELAEEGGMRALRLPRASM